MTVLHLSHRTTDSDRLFQEQAQSDQSMILLHPSDTTVEGFSIEFTMGDAWSENYGRSDTTMFKIPDDGIAIPRSSSVVVEVRQKITIPHNMYGLVIPTGSLFLDKGIIMAAAKIEPSFRGNLKLRLVNTSGVRQVLRPGDKLASGVFFPTETTMFQAEVTKRPATVSRRRSRRRAATTWLRGNWAQVVTWAVTAICSSMATLAVTRCSGPAQSQPPAVMDGAKAPEGNKQ